MRAPELVFADAGADGRAELVVNFGVFAGRQATPAEVERLAQALLADVPAVEIVCEQRYEFSLDAEATVFRVRVGVPGGTGAPAFLRDAVEAWARACIADRRLTP